MANEKLSKFIPDFANWYQNYNNISPMRRKPKSKVIRVKRKKVNLIYGTYSNQ